jgi:hypothetical protein
MADSKGDSKIVSKSKTTCACGAGCTCGCGCGCVSTWRIVKWIVGIIILCIVFFLGVKAGEFRVELRSMMYGGYYGHPMMMGQQGGGGLVPSTVATSTTSVTPTQ